MANSTPNPVANPAGSTQTSDGRVLDGAPVFDSARGHLMPAGATDRPGHHAARNGQAGHQRGH
jgi:hypothetical protein